MNADAINEIRKAAEAAVAARKAHHDKPTEENTSRLIVAYEAWESAAEPATVLELCRLAEIAEFLIDTADHIGAWNGPEPSPAEFHISWGTQQGSPNFNPMAELEAAARQWQQERAERVTWEPPK